MARRPGPGDDLGLPRPAPARHAQAHRPRPALATPGGTPTRRSVSFLGATQQAASAAVIEAVLDALPKDGAPLRADEITEVITSSGATPPQRQYLYGALHELKRAGRVAVSGSGKRGDPYLWRLPRPGEQPSDLGLHLHTFTGPNPMPKVQSEASPVTHRAILATLDATTGRTAVQVLAALPEPKPNRTHLSDSLKALADSGAIERLPPVGASAVGRTCRCRRLQPSTAPLLSEAGQDLSVPRSVIGRPKEPCIVCGGVEFWHRPGGMWFCHRCFPSVPPAAALIALEE